MTTTKKDSEARLRALDEILTIPLPLGPEHLEEAIGLCETEEDLHDDRLLGELGAQNREDKDRLRRLWAERRHLISEGLL